MSIDLSGRVAIVTGAGRGLGRAHALALAARGAKVVVNDLGGSVSGAGASSDAARSVVDEIIAAGGEAFADGSSVTQYNAAEDMVREAVKRWGRIDILVNNAGFLRDKSFAKVDLADFRAVVDVHLFGAVNCTKACWDLMREQNYGRVVFTTSSAGLYGNFGQSSYAAAKLALVGLMNTLAKEGVKNDIRVNAISPVAATRMTEALLTSEQLELLAPEKVSAAVCFLASDAAPTRAIVTAGAGGVALARICETQGAWLGDGAITGDQVEARWEEICDPAGATALAGVEEQTGKFLRQAAMRQSRPAP